MVSVMATASERAYMAAARPLYRPQPCPGRRSRGHRHTPHERRYPDRVPRRHARSDHERSRARRVANTRRDPRSRRWCKVPDRQLVSVPKSRGARADARRCSASVSQHAHDTRSEGPSRLRGRPGLHVAALAEAHQRCVRGNRRRRAGRRLSQAVPGGGDVWHIGRACRRASSARGGRSDVSHHPAGQPAPVCVARRKPTGDCGVARVRTPPWDRCAHLWWTIHAIWLNSSASASTASTRVDPTSWCEYCENRRVEPSMIVRISYGRSVGLEVATIARAPFGPRVLRDTVAVGNSGDKGPESEQG